MSSSNMIMIMIITNNIVRTTYLFFRACRWEKRAKKTKNRACRGWKKGCLYSKIRQALFYASFKSCCSLANT
jgi:hypothetical protein